MNIAEWISAVRFNLISAAGMIALMVIAWALSTNRRKLNWHAVVWGVVIQLAIAFLVFRVEGSRRVFLWLNDRVFALQTAAMKGPYFLFGRLTVPPGTTGPQGETSLGFFLAFYALPIIIFFSALMALLYHWRIMPLIIRGFARLFSRFMRTSGAESLCAASNIFVGIESATAVRPYLSKMTRSELCTILTAGMATIASSVLVTYASVLKGAFPTIAGHLISASILSAPAAIVMSKLLLPEEEAPLTMGRKVTLTVDEASSSVESIINGAMAGLKLVFGICALLIAFLGLVAVVNLILAGCGVWELDRLLGAAMAPFALLIGVPPGDALTAGTLLGQRLVETEFIAYQELATLMAHGGFCAARSEVITAYALCGFAHIASLAIFVGGIAALVPERRKDLAAIGPRALIAATLACLMTGAVAGVFYHEAATVLQAAAT